MELAYKKLGEGPPLIILHGLYGMSDNWVSIGRELAKKHEVYLVDLRNHGDSPHSSSMSYPEMARDIFVFYNHHSIEKAIVLGHSMGGKTAMFFAALYPEMVEKLIVIDISPVNTTSGSENSSHTRIHKGIVSTLQSLELNQINTRSEVMGKLEKRIGSKPVAQFLMKNIVRDSNNRFSWKLNLDTISKDLNEIFKGLDKADIPENKLLEKIPVLFIKGGKSDYLPNEHYDSIKELFPSSKIKTIDNAGHWVHAEQPKAFLKIVNSFL